MATEVRRSINVSRKTNATTVLDAKLPVTTTNREAIPSAMYKADLLQFELPSFAKGSAEEEDGLSKVPLSTLQKCLQPVLEGLGCIDGEALLNLDRVKEGASLYDGVRVRPIHEEISPPCEEGTVRYIHLSEVHEQYSMGIFVFPPHSKMPLHGHPGMCVLSRVLYGDVHRLSLDLARDDDKWEGMEDDGDGAAEHRRHDNNDHRHDDDDDDCSDDSDHTPIARSSSAEDVKKRPASSPRRLDPNGWLPLWAGTAAAAVGNNNKNSSSSNNIPWRSRLPPGTMRAYRNRIDHLVAPGCAALYPYEGNLHEFVAGPNGAAILDVLLPPYDVDGSRDCIFYEIHECRDVNRRSSQKQNLKPCWIVPTGQPEDFHCISGKYKDLGSSC